jgi:DNA-binding LytR/AlgR family response regulator
VKILVVDDERLARARLIRMLASIPGTSVVGEAANGADALRAIAELEPEVLLLDVEMPGLDGLGLAERPGMPPIIFTTAHAKFAADAFDLDAVDYLVKPVRQDRLERALERVRRRGQTGGPSPIHQIAVHGPGAVRFFDARRVTAFRALDKYTEFTADGEQHLIRESLEALAGRLADLDFVRVHRSALVRRDAVVELATEGSSLFVRLNDGTSVEVSRRQAAELRKRLGLRG